MDRLRRSFRDSFRRRKGENISEASRPQQWQSDEMDVRAGTCFFHVKYLGCVEVFESRGMQVCEEALRKLNNRKKRPIKAILYVSGDGLRVVEDDTKGLIVDQTIEKVSFCAPDRNHERGFSYICRDGTTRRWLCHGFLSLRESGERLSHAVGCAFAVCLERKQKRDQECTVTMNFDPSNATFTRMGSFKQPLLTDRLPDTTNVNNNVNLIPAAIVAAAASNNATSNNTTAVANINNNVGTNNCNRKENVTALQTTPKVSTKAIERPHASVSLLQRQGSFRGLSHLNHASPFKRQLSLRINDLPSNVERTRSQSLEYTFNPSSKTLTPLSLTKTAVSPIPESSPTRGNVDANKTAASPLNAAANVSDQVNAMCQQLSRGLSLLSKNDDDELLAAAGNARSSQLIGFQPTGPSFPIRQQSLIGDSCEQSLLRLFNEAATANGDANVINNNAKTSAISSVENIIPLTPPSTPPPPADAQLPNADQWLGKVAQRTMNVSSATAPAPPPIFARKTPPAMALHARAYSLSSAETAFDEKPSSGGGTFSIDWTSLAAKTPKPMSFDGSTNPFLSSSSRASLPEQSVKTFEVQM